MIEPWLTRNLVWRRAPGRLLTLSTEADGSQLTLHRAVDDDGIFDSPDIPVFWLYRDDAQVGSFMRWPPAWRVWSVVCWSVCCGDDPAVQLEGAKSG